MLFVETLDEFEIVARIVVGEGGGLRVGQRAGHTQANIVPVNVCFQRVVYEGRLLVKLVDEFARQGV